MPLEETMEALTDAVRQGKVRYLGFSEWPEEKIREAQAMAGVEHFVSSQPQYSMLWRGPERDVIPASRELGISQIVWSPLAQGVLTGKYKPGAPVPSLPSSTPACSSKPPSIVVVCSHLPAPPGPHSGVFGVTLMKYVAGPRLSIWPGGLPSSP